MAAVIAFTASCTGDYLPTKTNVPLLSNSQQFQAKIGGSSSGVEAQMAYAVTKNIGVMANGSFADRGGNTKEEVHKHQYFEFGTGFFNPISVNDRLELYAGYGFGELEGLFQTYNDKNSGLADIEKLFLQPNYGFVKEKYAYGFSARFSMVKITPADTVFASAAKFYPFVEPAITGKFGFKNFKLFAQAGLSIPLVSENELNFTNQLLMLSAGIHIDLGWKFYQLSY
jgi:hypothetical protein